MVYFPWILFLAHQKRAEKPGILPELVFFAGSGQEHRSSTHHPSQGWDQIQSEWKMLYLPRESDKIGDKFCPLDSQVSSKWEESNWSLWLLFFLIGVDWASKVSLMQNHWNLNTFLKFHLSLPHLLLNKADNGISQERWLWNVIFISIVISYLFNELFSLHTGWI